MRVLKHHEFAKWAKSEGLTDKALKKAVDEMNSGLFEANLGSGLFKKRVAAPGRGKRSGFRTLLAFHIEKTAIFIYGFKKNEKENLTIKEKQVYRDLAYEYLSLTPVFIRKMIKANILLEVK